MAKSLVVHQIDFDRSATSPTFFKKSGIWRLGSCQNLCGWLLVTLGWFSAYFLIGKILNPICHCEVLEPKGAIAANAKALVRSKFNSVLDRCDR